MRDENRLYSFYNEMQSLHTQMPDIRFGQLMESFRIWLQTHKQVRDMFYLEENDFIGLLREYVMTTAR